jgi:uncharacterized protein YyaL (SSP411 family)
MPNHLVSETSPYLLQHAHNPVDWYPWNEEALEKAHREDKPIFLSIGYAACHWCHVMAHESFENPETARLMNQNFINIKVDREERPDLDGIYMSAVISMSGQGGWPMSVFLTPDGEPFYGGTYFPPSPRYGMPGFRDVLMAIDHVWRDERDQAFQVSKQIVEHLQSTASWGSRETQPLSSGDLETAVKKLVSNYDWQNGGWGNAPRFPAPMTIEFLLQQGTRDLEEPIQAAAHALKTMQRGGMYDVVGGGFHRYSTDDRWLVPHFEKMLYDNAQLALAYLHAYLLSGESSFRITCEETLDFLLREMTHPLGGLYSSLDADSDGHEGQFYIWSIEEIHQVITGNDEWEFFQKMYPVSVEGNFQGKNILQKATTEEELASDLKISTEETRQRLANIHQRLLAARGQRTRPQTDDKILTAWNGMALKALAEAGRSLGREDFILAAQKNADFLITNLYFEDRLHRSWRDGQARHDAFLEDYAALCLGLIALYQSDGKNRWYSWAVRLSEEMKANFTDPAGGFFDTRLDQGGLLVRPKSVQDNAVPSGNALAAQVLLQMAELSGNLDQRNEAEKLLASLRNTCLGYPSAFSFWLQAMDFAVGPIQQIALVWPAGMEPPSDFLGVVNQKYRPRAVVAFASFPVESNQPELLQSRSPVKDRTTAYVCQRFICQRPTTSLEEFRSLLGDYNPA